MLPESERIKSKSQLKEWLKYEKSQYSSKGIRCIFPITENDLLCKHQIILRKTEYYLNSNKKILGSLYKIRLLRMQNRYALHIPVNTCGKGLKIMHVGPVLINRNAIVGENCAFHINTAVVASGPCDDVPTLGKSVILGVGAKVIGAVKIADNVAVGANAVVTKSITEEDIAVAGVPAKKISSNGRSQWNIKRQQSCCYGEN